MKKRTIKPGFFADTKTGRLSITSQMLFIGMWCLADREGYIEYDIEFIRIQIFPYQKIDIKNNMEELLKNNLILKCKYEEKILIHIINFKKHQPIHPHEASSQYPSIENENVITCNYNVIGCNDKILHPKGKGKGKGNNTNLEDYTLNSKNCAKEMIQIWNEVCTNLPQATQKKDSRNKILNNLIGNKDYLDENGKPVFETLEDWKAYCRNINQTPFLIGENDRGWKADIDFCIEKRKKGGIISVLEKKYNGKKDGF